MCVRNAGVLLKTHTIRGIGRGSWAWSVGEKIHFIGPAVASSCFFHTESQPYECLISYFCKPKQKMEQDLTTEYNVYYNLYCVNVISSLLNMSAMTSQITGN